MSEEFKESMEKESFTYSSPEPKEQKNWRRRRPSLFGPIMLIAVGVFFLLSNLGFIQDYSFNWAGLFQLWPLFLILIGLNIVVKQAPQPLGGLLSALVGLAAILIFGYVLLFGEDNAILNQFGISNASAEWTTEQINYATGDVKTAVIEIDFGAAGGDVTGLLDSNALIAGQVAYVGDLIFNTNTSGNHADVFLTEKNEGWRWLNPANWHLGEESSRWQIGINPAVETELRLDSGAGSVNYELTELTLSYLIIDSGAGSTTVTLPNGIYDVDSDQGAGSLKMTLPENGRQTIKLDSGAGSITLYLPAEMAAHVDMDSGAGSFNPGSRFIQISGDNHDGIWETADYANADNRVELIIDQGAGSVTIREK